MLTITRQRGMNDKVKKGFDYWWQVSGDWVEPLNERRGGTSGVIRHVPEQGPTLYIKRQEGHIFRSLRYPFGRPTCLREARALAHFRAMGFVVPVIRFFDLRKKDKWHAVLVTETLPEDFVSLDNFYPSARGQSLSAAMQEMIIENLATTLARLHKLRWQHSSLMPKHIFIRLLEPTDSDQPARVEVAFLDLERARRQFSIKRASRRDLHFMRERLLFWTEHDWAHFDRCYEQAFRQRSRCQE